LKEFENQIKEKLRQKDPTMENVNKENHWRMKLDKDKDLAISNSCFFNIS